MLKENYKSIGKVGLQVGKTWFFAIIIGCLTYVITGIIIFYLLLFGSNLGTGGHAGGSLYVYMIFFQRPFACILAMIVYFIFPFIYFIVANKLAIQKALYVSVKEKIDWLSPVLEKTLKKIGELQPELLKKIKDEGLLNEKLLNEFKKDRSISKWQKRVLNYGFKKVKLENISLQSEELNISKVLSQKIIEALKGLATPSKKLLWISIGVNILITLLIYIF